MSNKNSNNLTNCDSCDSCDYCYSCYYSEKLRMSEFMIFCSGEGKYKRQGIGYQKNYHAFNKFVGESRYEKILKIVREALKDFKLDATKDWSDEWKKVTNDQWSKIAEIPEFDKDVVEKIIGFKLDLSQEDEVDVTIEGNTVRISRKSAITLGLLNRDKV